MATPQTQARARRVAAAAARSMSEDIRRLREDAGLSRAMLASEAGLDRTFLGRIEDGRLRPSLNTYARIAGALGADLSARLYPNTGPSIHDGHQVRILEALLAEVHPLWQRYLEVAVRHPARGWIDLVLQDAANRLVVAVEVQSTLPRLEQLIRWAGEKATSLPSWEGYAQLGPVDTRSQLLVVRATRSTMELGRDVARQLEVAYPAHPQDALAALRAGRPWPGPALIWVDIRAHAIRFSQRRATEPVRVGQFAT